jgi:hypothetical protein
MQTENYNRIDIITSNDTVILVPENRQTLQEGFWKHSVNQKMEFYMYGTLFSDHIIIKIMCIAKG